MKYEYLNLYIFLLNYLFYFVFFFFGGGLKNAKRVWLGKWNSSTDHKPEAGDRQKIEQYMRLKYDVKKWYVPEEV
jgi:hypothetical protein